MLPLLGVVTNLLTSGSRCQTLVGDRRKQTKRAAAATGERGGVGGWGERHTRAEADGGTLYTIADVE